MEREREEYIGHIIDLEGDIAGREQALEFIRTSDVWVHGQPAPFPYVPYLFNDEDMEFIERTCAMAHGILCKVIRRYLDDPGYRSVFSFPPQVERLILLPCNYDQLLPMGRFDIFLDEHDYSYKFCEFNTDGSGAMSRDYMIARALEGTESFRRFASDKRIERFELFDSWVEAFMRIYRTDANAVEAPTVAITDFRESGVFSDFDRFIAAFERAGIPARFVDVRDFAFDGDSLVDSTDGTRIDAIYRRSVTSEILQHPGECDALIDAVAAEKVCLIGHFRTTVVHSKMVSVALFDEATRREFLSDEECAFIDAHLPRTYQLKSDGRVDFADVKANRRAWIIKPEDDYGSHGVFPGVDFEQQRWEEIVDECCDRDFIVQEFYQPHTVPIVNTAIDPDDPCKVEQWQSMPGFYVYDGKPVGFYCRLGNEGIIAIEHGGLCSCSFRVRS